MIKTSTLIKIIFIVLIVLAIIISIISKIIKKKHKSKEYILKEKNRLTTKKDINKLKKKYSIPQKEANILWNICKTNKVTNINYLLSDFNAIQNILKNGYTSLRASKASEQTISTFFKLLYTMEKISTETKKYSSTEKIPLSTIIFYVSPENEQYPLFLVENKENYYCLELPDFLYKTNLRPQTLSKLKMMMKTQDGICYYFISRLLRYEILDDKIKMVLTHTTKLEIKMQRHYRREIFSTKCNFSPVHVTNTSKTNTTFQISDKKYDGTIQNISGGGACVKTHLPIREGQYLSLYLSELKIDEPVIGIIKRTRKLSDGKFAIHIQFLNFSLKTQNTILSYVYKYNL